MSGIDPGFLFWVLSSRATQAYYSVEATGVTRFGLRAQAIRNTPVPHLPFADQRVVADFLDRETARIDELIDLSCRSRNPPSRS